MATLGSRIKECREARGWRSGELAKKAGISPGFLSDVENNLQKNPGINYVRTIAHALSVDLHFLITGEGAPRNTSVQMPASLLTLAKEEQLSVSQMLMLLDARRQIVSHRSNGSKSDDLEDFEWRLFYQAIKSYLK
jgi:XRE family transcriptional regulator of biofilm formation